jgi:hypothetical protein
VDFQKILSSRGLNTLIFTDPYAKLCFSAFLSSLYQKTLYIDLDSAFSAYLQSDLIRPSGKVVAYLPSNGELVPMLKDAISSMDSDSLVILDSVNSFYSLFKTNEKNLGSLNHLLSVILMLLVRRGSDVGAPVLATSMLRYRQTRGWVQSPTSKRLLQNKSEVKMKVDRKGEGEIVLTILEHGMLPAGSELVVQSSITV